MDMYLFSHALYSPTFDFYAERQCGVRSLPMVPTIGHSWELNPRAIDHSDAFDVFTK